MRYSGAETEENSEGDLRDGNVRPMKTVPMTRIRMAECFVKYTSEQGGGSESVEN
jgi:hypothetical protein